MEAALRQGSVIAMLVMGVLAPVTSLHADVQCSKLASAPEVDFAAAARIDTAIDGWFETPGRYGASLDQTYRGVAATMMTNAAQIDRLNLWRRVILRKCQVLDASDDLNASQKLHAFDELMRRFYSPPPPLATGP